jgi:predicted MPP superfamily phosphohydrolase
MFLLNELILLSPLAVYVYFRLKSLSGSRIFKIVFTAAFVLVGLAYPLAERLSHSSAGSRAKYLIIAGYYALPFLLYLVMTVILADLIVGSGRLFRVISRETVRAPLFRRARLISCLLAPALIVILGIANYHYLRVRHYTVEVPRRSSSIKELNIVFAADLHLSQITATHFLERFVDKVNARNPDIVLIGGDILEGHGENDAAGQFGAQFRRLRSKYGVYAVPGNHEGHGESRKDFFDRAGIRFLEDEVVKIDRGFYLAGRRDAHSTNRKSPEELLRDTPADLPVILMDHRPTDLERVSQSRVDIQLSGHTHHGQLFPVNLITARLYELSWGYLRKRQTHFFVTSGAQVWGPPVRTAGASEILAIRVVLKEGQVSAQ